MERAVARSNIPQCCCGSEECVFLAHNSSLLEDLERDLHKAAQLGQALLVRHEAYVQDSERERRQMAATMESLEKEKLELEQKNTETIKANRELLDQLEQLNDAVAASDAQVQALTDTLHSTEEEIQRLASLAARTQVLEQQLIDLEREQIQLQGSLESKTCDERTAVQRWKKAEKTIGDLQDQLDRIEKEAREERERHVEIVARMERRMAVEGELATASGRLKAKAGQQKGGTNVVSHFVKDILLDNTSLQHGILELKEMLLNSNEEVERLRERLRVHQPVSPTTEDVPTPSLQNELGNDQVFNHQFHIHHHYHGPKKDTSKGQPYRRPKKKRNSLTPNHFTFPFAQPDPSTSTAILAQTAVTVPSNTNRWSNATTLTASSLPGSPISTSHRGSSIYERVFSDVAYDSSRPTSPSDSLDMSSPMFGPSKLQEDSMEYGDFVRHRKRLSQSLKPPSPATIRSVSTPISVTTKSSPATAIVSAVGSHNNSLANDIFALSPGLHAAIPEESEDVSTPDTNSILSPAFEIDDEISPLTQMRPPLRRAASHESLISVSGMDIHTLQSRPSQLLFSSSPHFSSPVSRTSTDPVLTPWTATAATGDLQRDLGNGTLNRSLLYTSLAHQRRAIRPAQAKPPADTLSKKVGGWVFGKWGATPASFRSVSEASQVQSDTTSVKSKDSAKDVTPTAKKEPLKLRPAGVNQNGPIWGFFDIPPTPTKVVVTDLDNEALGEALAEN